jgi:alkylation response protein AidB-like acyl-CoA dehydrogenase
MDEQEVRKRTRALLEKAHPDRVDRVAFRGAQYDEGLAWVHFPEGFGGLGLSPRMQATVNDEISLLAKTTYSDMMLNPIGIGMGAPTVLTHGTDWMRQNLLRRIFTGEDIWCQLFSEPGAGSDVAGLSTRAELRGDHWILNGQKVWTSLAHVSRWGMLLARTDPDVPKHDGLSYFLLDMHAPGVEVRPLYQITGEAEFNEVFLNDVRIPQEYLFGKPGQGWQVAITTLMNERVAIGGASRPGAGLAAPLVSLWKETDKSRLSDAERAGLLDRVTRLHIESELLGITAQRAKAAQRARNPGPEGSVGKLAQAEINKRLWECAIDVIGAEGLLFEAGFERRQGRGGAGGRLAMAKYQFLRSRANSIEGGTSEIMKNILGERVLGLPGEPRVDKNVAWKDVPRS